MIPWVPASGPYPWLRTAADRERFLTMYLDRTMANLDQLAADLAAGTLSVADWESAMRDALRKFHQDAALIAKGLGTDLDRVEVGRWSGVLRWQYDYLHRYADYAQAGPRSQEYLTWRSRLYLQAARPTFWRVLSGGRLPFVPGSGATSCGPGCRCQLALFQGDMGELLVYWQLSPGVKKHCGDCERLANEWNPYVALLEVR